MLREPSKHSAGGPPVLDYLTPRALQWPNALRVFHRLGPWWPKPSLMSIVSSILLIGAAFALSRTGQNWRAGRSRSLTLTSGSGFLRRSLSFIPMPRQHAVFCLDSTGQPILWRPWDDATLARFPIPIGRAEWLAASADESRLLTATSSGLLLWDANGALLHQLIGGRTPYLAEPDGTEPHLSTAVLSSDGSRLAALDFEGQLELWDLTGPSGKRITKQAIFGGWVPEALLAFAPDDRHILVTDPNQRTYLVDSTSLASVVQVKRDYFTGSIAEWMDGGQTLVAAEGPYDGGGCGMSLRECDTGKYQKEWTLEQVVPAAVKVSPDGRHVAVASSSFHAGAYIDLTMTPPAVRQAVPLEFPQWGDMQFFADSRRAVVSSWHSRNPAIVDLVSGHHLGTLPIPPPPAGGMWNPYPPTIGLLISPDEQRIAARLGDGSVQMFDRVGADSAWGIAGTPMFLVVAVLLAMWLASLWRDADRSEPVAISRRRVAAGMVILSGPALLFLCASVAVWFAPDADHHWYWWDHHWVAVIFAAWLAAGLGVRGGSPLWNALATLLLIGSAGICVLMTLAAPVYCAQPFIVLDRVAMLPTAPVAALCAAGATASLTLLRWHSRKTEEGVTRDSETRAHATS